MHFPVFTKFLSSRAWVQIQVCLTPDLAWLPFLRAGLWFLHISLSLLHYSLSWVVQCQNIRVWRASDVPCFNFLTTDGNGLREARALQRGWLTCSANALFCPGILLWMNTSYILLVDFKKCNYGSTISPSSRLVIAESQEFTFSPTALCLAAGSQHVVCKTSPL